MKYFFILIITNLIFSCKSIHTNETKMNSIFESKEFMEILKHHSKKENIIVYDATENNIFEKEYGLYKSYNKNELKFIKIDFTLNVNSKTNNIGIVLYRFEKKGNKKIYYFVDIENKFFIHLCIKKNKNIRQINIGNF
jgi:hypothetical protein